MLSRIAESLFWLGRYVERAEDTARILDVHVLHLLGDPLVGEDAVCRGLLSVMGVAAPAGELDARRVCDVLAFAEEGPASIVSSLVAARQSARGIREVLSGEIWESLNATYNELPRQVPRANRLGPHAFFQFVKERTAALAGLTDSTMSRDDGWQFLVLGRSIERVDMTSRLVLARCNERSTPADWATTLACCSAYEAFLRTYRREVEPVLVAEFLLLDRLFPRSAFHALTLAESCLGELEGSDGGRAGVDDEARRILGRARTDLEFAKIEELMGDLPGHLLALQKACAEAGSAISRRFFRLGTTLEWTLEGT
ncbi:MAG TPA: alpha-E domain-containing protein, partial [Acidimicrobiales bacterium]